MTAWEPSGAWVGGVFHLWEDDGLTADQRAELDQSQPES